MVEQTNCVSDTPCTTTLQLNVAFFWEDTQALQKANESLAQWTLSIMSTLISKLLGTKWWKYVKFNILDEDIIVTLRNYLLKG